MMNKMRTNLSGHKQVGKTLIPPFAQLPRMTRVSWQNERLPDMLWSIVIAGSLERERALCAFRRLANAICEDPSDGDIRLTGLARLNEEQFSRYIGAIIEDPAAQNALRSMLVLDTLPGRSAWISLLGEGLSDTESWNILMDSVGKSLWHQSETATDCRWIRVVAMMASGMFHDPCAEEYLQYPNLGDQKKVRPMIRANELTLDPMFGDNTDSLKWAEIFWRDCLHRTECLVASSVESKIETEIGSTIDKIQEVWDSLGEHFINTTATTATDAKHDAVFGIAFYSLSILHDLFGIGNNQKIMSRLGLRAILECLITIKYLVIKDNEMLWKTYRVYGSGQAKLAFLKLKDLDPPPKFISLEDLDLLINEDFWDEFLEINLGHWENSNLIRMSKDAMAKDLYDKYYPWTSAFMHGNWGAIRDSVFETCLNPLHRLHRVPRRECRCLPDVIPDACRLVDMILDALEQCYKPFALRVSLTKQ